MLRQKAVCLACVGAGLIILLGTGVRGAAGTKGTGQDLAAIKAEIIRVTNAERAKAKLPPLEEDPTLARVAQAHSDHMAQVWNDLWAQRAKEAPNEATVDRMGWVGERAVKHDLGKGNSGARVKAAAPGQYNFVAENIQQGLRRDDAAAAVAYWMDSPGHKSNILTNEGTRIGVGVTYTSSGHPMFTQVFGGPQ